MRCQKDPDTCGRELILLDLPRDSCLENDFSNEGTSLSHLLLLEILRCFTCSLKRHVPASPE